MKTRGDGYVYPQKGSAILWCQYFDGRGNRIRKSTGETDAKKAERFLKDRVAEVRVGMRPDVRKITYADLRAAYYADYETNDRKSLHRDAEGHPHLDKVARLDSFFEGFLAADIDADLIRKFHVDQQAKGLSNGSINRSVSALRRMFHLAKQDGRVRDLPYFPILKESAPRQGFLERADYERLLAVMPDYLRPVLSIAYFTGTRLSEILNLQWGQVHFPLDAKSLGTIELRAGETKNDEGRTIPMLAELRSILAEQHTQAVAGFPYVCFRKNRKGQPERIGSFKKAWQNRCVLLGLGKFETVPGTATRTDRPNAKPKPKRVYVGTLFHDLRRTGVRNLDRAGVPQVIAMKISGHKTTSVYHRYNIVSDADLREAARRLEQYHAEQHLAAAKENSQETARTMHQNAAGDLPVF